MLAVILVQGGGVCMNKTSWKTGGPKLSQKDEKTHLKKNSPFLSFVCPDFESEYHPCLRGGISDFC